MDNIFNLLYNKFFADLLRSNWYKKQVVKNPRRALSLKWWANYRTSFPFKNPQTLDEKIGWLQINTDTSQWSLFADKWAVREYLKEKGLEDILIPVYGIWEHVDDIDFDALPNEFVIKCTHDCGSTIVVKDKSKMDETWIKKRLLYCLSRKIGYSTFEPHYHKIKPRVIAERLLENDKKVQSTSIVDYKIWCLNGEPYCVLVCYDRHNNHDAIKDLYNINPWNPIRHNLSPSKRNQNFRDVPKPDNFEDLVQIAKKIAKGIPQVRLDMYIVNNKIYFSEMTMTSSGGVNATYSKEFLLDMGKKMRLPNKS